MAHASGFDRIGEQCLAGLAINERVLEVDRQFRIYANETDVSITNFITYLDSTTPTVNAIKSNPGTLGPDQRTAPWTIVDQIYTDSGVTFICPESAYAGMNQCSFPKIYRVGAVCTDLYESSKPMRCRQNNPWRSMICEVGDAEASLPAAAYCRVETQILSFLAAN
jgi:hypothetical protein